MFRVATPTSIAVAITVPEVFVHLATVMALVIWAPAKTVITVRRIAAI